MESNDANDRVVHVLDKINKVFDLNADYDRKLQETEK